MDSKDKSWKEEYNNPINLNQKCRGYFKDDQLKYNWNTHPKFSELDHAGSTGVYMDFFGQGKLESMDKDKGEDRYLQDVLLRANGKVSFLGEDTHLLREYLRERGIAEEAVKCFKEKKNELLDLYLFNDNIQQTKPTRELTLLCKQGRLGVLFPDTKEILDCFSRKSAMN